MVVLLLPCWRRGHTGSTDDNVRTTLFHFSNLQIRATAVVDAAQVATETAPPSMLWDFAVVTQQREWRAAVRASLAVPLGDLVREASGTITPKLTAIPWSDPASAASGVGASTIYVTHDFSHTIERSAMTGRATPPTTATATASGGQWVKYLRPADWVLVFSGGKLLLISEFEANALRPMFQRLVTEAGTATATAATQTTDSGSADGLALSGVLLTQVCNVVSSVCRDGVPATTISSQLLLSIADADLVRLQLYNGDTMFPTSERKHAARRLLHRMDARLAALSLPVVRGRGSAIDRSDLEEVCEAEGTVTHHAA